MCCGRLRVVTFPVDVQMPRPHTLLVGSAGTGTAFHAICALRRHWYDCCTIVSQDINPPHLVTAALFADHHEQCPLATDAGFVDYLSGTIRRHNANQYLPLIPDEVAIARTSRSTINDAGASVISAAVDSPIDLSDKWAVAEASIAAGIPTPSTALAEPLGDHEAFFAKPRFGFGSRGAGVMTRSELASLDSHSKAELIVQERCEGPEVTVDAFVLPEDGYTHAIARERIDVKAGVCVKARLFADPELTSIANAISSAFRLQGTFCFQVMQLRGRWALTDLNPRPGAGTSMSIAAGSDFFAAMFAQAFGEDFTRFLDRLDGSVFVTRQYADFLHAGP